MPQLGLNSGDLGWIEEHMSRSILVPVKIYNHRKPIHWCCEQHHLG
jgi:hypothetical protein